MPLYGNELDRRHDALRGRPGPLRAPRPRDRPAGQPRLRGPCGPGGAGSRTAAAPARGPRAARTAASPVTATPSGAAGQPEPIGSVTSGSQSPTLGEAIAMAYVPPSDAATGTMLEVAIREAARRRRGRAPAVLPTAALTAPGPGPAGARPDRRRRVEVADGRSRDPALHRRPRVAAAGGGRGRRRHHRLRRRGAGRHRLRGAARRGPPPARRARPSASSSRSRRPATCTPRWRARSWPSTRPSPRSRSWSTASPTPLAGWSGCAWTTRPPPTACWTPAAYRAQIGG